MQVPISLDFAPGIQRDGTLFDSEASGDALWCRWRLKRPRKMGGYKEICDVLAGVPRRIHIFYLGATAIVHVGTTVGLQQVVIDYQGNFISVADRTPASGFTPGLTVGWTFDALFNSITGVVDFIAHSVPDTGYPASQVKTVPFLGDITATTPLVQFTAPASLGGGTYVQPSVASGIVSVQPYVFAYDTGGLVQWSAPSVPLALGVTGGTTGAGSARISAQKIMAGAALRGGGTQQPACIFWSLSEVITGVFVGSNAGIFAFSTVSPSSSILSSDCVIEYDGIYYWIGIDRFLAYNGTVIEVPNPNNRDWFFGNLNWPYAGQVQAFKMPAFGEIWWLAPMFGNTECSHAIIYNVREQCWYDTVLPNSGRTAGASAQGLRYPIMGDAVKDPDNNGYRLWLHEFGVDEVNDVDGTVAVRSYFETPVIGGPKNRPPSDRGLSIQQFEADIQQAGDMTISIIGQANMRAPVATSPAEVLKLTPSVPQEQLVSFKLGHRLCRLHIESNVVGGNYVCGRNLLHAEQNEARIVG